jgi:hypothetical protein
MTGGGIGAGTTKGPGAGAMNGAGGGGYRQEDRPSARPRESAPGASKDFILDLLYPDAWG